MSITDVLLAILKVLILLLGAPLLALILVYVERKTLGRIQRRMGPWHVGPMGLLQTLADAVKLLTKEVLTPERAEPWAYRIAPIVVFVPGILALIVIPFTPTLVVSDIDISLLYVFALPAISTVGFIMAGWGSGSKYALLGGIRLVAQAVSYEIPLLFSVLGVAILAGSLSLTNIVNAQIATVWYIVVQPAAFIIFLMAGLAEHSRTPFDMAIGESEVMGGPTIEYSGIRWAMFMLAEYVYIFVLASLGTVIFLGGWDGPFLPGWIWYIVKTAPILLFIFWLRGTLPRLRIDQLMGLCWKVLLPISLLNLIVAATFKLYGWGPTVPLVILSVFGSYLFYRRQWLQVVSVPEGTTVQAPMPSTVLSE
jgi:NADH-quinone oxidoreductase subunit H